jgi:hypothetical protein
MKQYEDEETYRMDSSIIYNLEIILLAGLNKEGRDEREM